jgi:hypothetical protein
MRSRGVDPASVARICADSRPGLGVEDLLDGLGHLLPRLAFKPVLARGGWYRPGGVVDIDQHRIADSLRQWAERQAPDGDMQPLLDACMQGQLFATRLVGRTHYLTAATADAAAEFVQLEVEELQEVLGRYLSDPDWLPESLEEFVDPLDYPQLEPEPVGTPRLVFRRFVAVPELLADPDALHVDDLRRFLQDWERSSAQGAQGHFCEHWILAIQDFIDSDGDARRNVHPVPARPMERMTVTPGSGGAVLANLIQLFDRKAGYPMAWFFHLVATGSVPHAVGMQIVEDHDEGFSYLPARDLEMLRNWAAAPYRA